MRQFISGSEVKRLIAEENAVLVDVRNPGEFANGSAPGAVNMPLNAIMQWGRELADDAHLILFCVSGNRSAQAQMILNSIGVSNVKNAGGLNNVLGT